MNFQEADKQYKEFKAQHDAGKLNDVAFEAEVGKLRLQDEQGRWWQIGVQTGEWYMHDGQKWNKAKPPAAATPTAQPAPVEKPAPVPAPMPAPKATAEKKTEKVEASPKAEKEKQPRGSVLPARLFSSKPAGREGGLSRPMLIGIIAGVAVIILLLFIGGFFVVNNFLGTASKPTATATRGLAVLSSPTAPIVVPTARPTNTLEPPTPIVVPTTPITTTAATATRAPAGPTATRRPVTPSPVPTKGSPTPNVPPGFYVTKVETIPAKPVIGNQLGFKVTFLNTTGSVQTYKWMVKVFQCPEQCTGDTAFRHSYGETQRIDNNFATGTVEMNSTQTVNLGIGIRCDLVAIPYYVDPSNQAVIPFKPLNGNALYQEVKLCQ